MSVRFSCSNCDFNEIMTAKEDTYFTRSLLDGKDGWGIGVYWGEPLENFPSGATAYSLKKVELKGKKAGRGKGKGKGKGRSGRV